MWLASIWHSTPRVQTLVCLQPPFFWGLSLYHLAHSGGCFAPLGIEGICQIPFSLYLGGGEDAYLQLVSAARHAVAGTAGLWQGRPTQLLVFLFFRCGFGTSASSPTFLSPSIFLDAHPLAPWLSEHSSHGFWVYSCLRWVFLFLQKF